MFFMKKLEYKVYNGFVIDDKLNRKAQTLYEN